MSREGAVSDGGSWIWSGFKLRELKNSPSFRDGMSWLSECTQLRKSALFIEEMSFALKLPKIVAATAQVFLIRFFLRQSFIRHNSKLLSATALFLAAKVEENVQKVREVARVYARAAKIEFDEEGVLESLSEKIITMESVLLHTLKFELRITHPYKYINELCAKVMKCYHKYHFSTAPSEKHSVNFTVKLEKRVETEVKQITWNFLNDMVRTCISLQYSPYELACGAIYLASLYNRHLIPAVTSEGHEPWWRVLELPDHTIDEVSKSILDLYAHSQQKIPSEINRLMDCFHTSQNYPAHPIYISPPPPTPSPLPSIVGSKDEKASFEEQGEVSPKLLFEEKNQNENLMNLTTPPVRTGVLPCSQNSLPLKENKKKKKTDRMEEGEIQEEEEDHFVETHRKETKKKSQFKRKALNNDFRCFPTKKQMT